MDDDDAFLKDVIFWSNSIIINFMISKSLVTWQKRPCHFRTFWFTLFICLCMQLVKKEESSLHITVNKADN